VKGFAVVPIYGRRIHLHTVHDFDTADRPVNAASSPLEQAFRVDVRRTSARYFVHMQQNTYEILHKHFHSSLNHSSSLKRSLESLTGGLSRGAECRRLQTLVTHLLHHINHHLPLQATIPPRPHHSAITPYPHTHTQHSRDGVEAHQQGVDRTDTAAGLASRSFLTHRVGPRPRPSLIVQRRTYRR